jgi:hypothetical protein
MGNNAAGNFTSVVLQCTCIIFCLCVIQEKSAFGFPSSPEVSESGLEATLEKIGRSVESFWNEISAVTCTESVSQTKLGNQSKVVYQRDTNFDYLVLMSLHGDDISVEESRLLQKQSGKEKELPLLITNGFSTLALIFHPFYQPSFEYELVGQEVSGGRRLLKIHFKHVSGMRSTSVLRLRDRDYPLDLQGTAWVDADSNRIARINAELISPMEDVGLRSLQCVVQYAQVGFAPDVFWLPAEATIEVETRHQHWRNTHRFANYKQFTVKSETTVSR